MRARSKFGIAIAAMIRMIATTISNSISEKPFCLRISSFLPTQFLIFMLVSDMTQSALILHSPCQPPFGHGHPRPFAKAFVFICRIAAPARSRTEVQHLEQNSSGRMTNTVMPLSASVDGMIHQHRVLISPAASFVLVHDLRGVDF
jgi:hypothetical protein